MKQSNNINIKSMIIIITELITVFLLLGCNSNNKKEITIATGDVGGTYIIAGETLRDVLSDNDFKIKILSGKEYHGIANIKLLNDKKVDFAFVHNDYLVNDSESTEIQTVIPLYSHILFIISKNDIKANSLKELVKGRNVGISPKGGAASKFILRLFDKFGIVKNDYHPVFCNQSENIIGDSIDISCFLGGFNNPRAIDMIQNKNGRLFSLDEYTMFNKGSSVEGFCMDYIRAKPYLIPKHTYLNYPDKPVLTVALDILLVTRKDANEELVFDFVSRIFENRAKLGRITPFLSQITENFERAAIYYPLHQGVIRYIERKEPGFIEKYADTIGLGITILGMIAGAATGFIKWKNIRKKNRIDKYYIKLLNIDKDIDEINDNYRLYELSDIVNNMKTQAFNDLINEKIDANESFRIFITMTKDIVAKINHKINSAE